MKCLLALVLASLVACAPLPPPPVTPVATQTATIPATATEPAIPTDTATPTVTPSDTPRPVPTWTPKPTRTPAPFTPTSSTVSMSFAPTITVLPVPTTTSDRTWQCMLAWFDVKWSPGQIEMNRWNMGAYLDCIGNPVPDSEPKNARAK